MGPSIAPLRRCVLLALLIIFLFCVYCVLLAPPDKKGEELLAERLAELQVRLQHLKVMYRAREEDVRLLTGQVSRLINNKTLSPEARALFASNSSLPRETLLRLPSPYRFLPHLLLHPDSLKPAYHMSKGRSGVSVVMGVPTVRREVQSYLVATLKNLLDSMTQEEKDDSVIVVFIAETEQEYVLQVAQEIKQHFEAELEDGVLEVISPPKSYYPDLERLRVTLGDRPERVRWRTKQNLDFAFLMMYAQSKAMFYVQLEDDILAKQHFLTTMKTVALDRIANRKEWFVLDFCQLGFIGKMFRCVELPWLVQFFFLFYNDKPVDWLLDHLIQTKICSLEKDSKHCKKAKEELWIHYKPSLFQHIGTHSSLRGKVQKLKDKQFGKVRLHVAHSNPEAEVYTNIKPYKQYTLKRAYSGESFFWGLVPQPGDHLIFKFSVPLHLKRYVFRSGNVEHPSDRFYNTTVEVLQEVMPTNSYDSLNYTADGYYILGKFDNMGVAEGKGESKLGAIKEIRLTVHSESDKWAILSEILVEAEDPK